MFGKKNQKKQSDNQAKIGVGKFWAWESREFSDAAVALLLTYITFFCTDVLGISAIVVGTLMAASKVIDGITDLIAGYLVDNTNTKLGRGRPYDVCIFGLWLTIALLFACPQGLSDAGKVAWVLVFYILSQAVFQTLLNAGENVFMLRAFNEKQVIRLSSYGGIVMSLAGLTMGMLIPQFVKHAGTAEGSWVRMAVTLGIPLSIIGFARFTFVREKNDLIPIKKEHEEKMTFKQIGLLLVKNRYWNLLLVITLITNIVSNLGVGVYFFSKVLGNIGLQSYFAAASALAIPMLFALPSLLKKLGMRKLLISCSIISMVAFAVEFIMYKTVPLLIVMYVITSMANLPGTYLIRVMTMDNANYNEYMGLHRMEGTMGSLVGFMKRAGGAIGSFLLGIGLTAIHYNANAATLSAGTEFGLRFMMYGIPAISNLLVAILYSFYTLEKRMPEVNEANAKNREALQANEVDE